jgi:hypothetical protein
VIVPEALQDLDAPNLDEDWYFTMDVVEVDGRQIVSNDRNLDKNPKPRQTSVDALRLITQFQQEKGKHILYKLQSYATCRSVFVKSFDVPSVATFSDYKRAAAEPTSE